MTTAIRLVAISSALAIGTNACVALDVQQPRQRRYRECTACVHKGLTLTRLRRHVQLLTTSRRAMVRQWVRFFACPGGEQTAIFMKTRRKIAV